MLLEKKWDVVQLQFLPKHTTFFNSHRPQLLTITLICEATSSDGVTWQRGAPGENLALPPTGKGWESKLTEYPHIVREGDHLRLFYCGNGYGAMGIGTAVAEPLE